MTVKSANRGVKSAGRQAASSRWLEWLARGGFVARGVIYLLIGSLAVQIGLGAGGKEADRTGALHAIARQPGGTAALWLLAAGFAGMALWRLAEAAYGQAGPQGRKASKRVTSLARGVFYGFVCVGIVSFVSGSGAPAPGNSQSKDMTAQLMSHPGGRWLVLLIGLGVVGAGIGMVATGVRRKFVKQLRMVRMSPRTCKIVGTLGTVGTTARGVVFGIVGIFLVVAAATFDPKQAQGLDGALRKIATTPLGPWLLVAVALGLVSFGTYSWCEARWRKVQPG
jgi:Domain of Unknown Function (DUF1206)